MQRAVSFCCCHYIPHTPGNNTYDSLLIHDRPRPIIWHLFGLGTPGLACSVRPPRGRYAFFPSLRASFSRFLFALCNASRLNLSYPIGLSCCTRARSCARSLIFLLARREAVQCGLWTLGFAMPISFNIYFVIWYIDAFVRARERGDPMVSLIFSLWGFEMRSPRLGQCLDGTCASLIKLLIFNLYIRV